MGSLTNRDIVVVLKLQVLAETHSVALVIRNDGALPATFLLQTVHATQPSPVSLAAEGEGGAASSFRFRESGTIKANILTAAIISHPPRCFPFRLCAVHTVSLCFRSWHHQGLVIHLHTP